MVEYAAQGKRVFDELTCETEWGWVYYYGDEIGGATPVLIDKFVEKLIHVGQGPIDLYVDTYTKERDEIRSQTDSDAT